MLRRRNNFALNQMYKTARALAITEYWEFWIPEQNILRLASELILLMKLGIRLRKHLVEFALIDFRNSFMQSLMRFFKSANFVLLDDGFYTFVAYEKYMSRGIFLPLERYFRFRGIIVRWLYFGFSFKRLRNQPFPYLLFTQNILLR